MMKATHGTAKRCSPITQTKCSPVMKTSWFVIASGPSLTKEDVQKLKGRNVICINDNYKLAPWANALYACDYQWWSWHKDNEDLINFQGEKWTQTESWTEQQKQEIEALHKLNWIKSKAAPGLSTDPDVIHQGSNSGIQAINLAYHFGAQVIYLLGYDMQATNDKTHWFGDHPNQVKSSYHKWIPHYQRVADQEIVEIINLTRKTALECFPKQKLEDVLTL